MVEPFYVFWSHAILHFSTQESIYFCITSFPVTTLKNRTRQYSYSVLRLLLYFAQIFVFEGLINFFSILPYMEILSNLVQITAHTTMVLTLLYSVNHYTLTNDIDERSAIRMTCQAHHISFMEIGQ